MKTIFGIFAVGLLFSACEFKGTGTLKSNSSSAKVAAVVSEDGQEATGSFASGSGEVQVLEAPAGSEISGVLTSFPPGALAVDTEISIAPGANIVDKDELSETLGLDASNQIEAVGASISIQSSVAMNTSVPFSVQIQIGDAGLSLQDLTHYGIVFKAFDISTNSVIIGVIPSDQISIANGVVTFKTNRFGTYQLVKNNKPLEQVAEKAVASIDIQTPAELYQVVPFVADAGKSVILHGKDFSGKMEVSIAGIPIRSVSVKSDAQASFIVPKEVSFGFTDITIAQAGKTNSYGVFTRTTDKQSLPLLTIDEAGVCQGVAYYDANGDLKNGSKACSGGSDITKYDANNNGIIDRSDSATTAATASTAQTAGFANEAGFAKGKVGADIASAATVTIPAEGDYFRVTGNTTIKNFGVGVVGQRVFVEFTGTPLVATSTTSAPKLYLNSGEPFVAGTGTVLGLIGTGDGWREITRHQISAPPAFFAIMSNSGLSYVPGAQDNTNIPFKMSSVTFDPTHFSYNATTGDFQPLTTRQYKIEIDQLWEGSGSGAFTCYVGISANGSGFTEGYGYNTAANICEGYISPLTFSLYSTSTYNLYHRYYSSSGTATNFFLKSTSKKRTYVKITPQ